MPIPVVELLETLGTPPATVVECPRLTSSPRFRTCRTSRERVAMEAGPLIVYTGDQAMGSFAGCSDTEILEILTTSSRVMGVAFQPTTGASSMPTVFAIGVSGTVTESGATPGTPVLAQDGPFSHGAYSYPTRSILAFRASGVGAPTTGNGRPGAQYAQLLTGSTYPSAPYYGTPLAITLSTPQTSASTLYATLVHQFDSLELHAIK